MNSIELQKSFPKIYEDFFVNCQRVSSAPHSFLWVGDFSGFYGGLTISSKIPLRFYVGLEEISANKVEIDNEFYSYFPALKAFRKIKFDKHIKQALNDLLSSEFQGYRVHFLSELSLGLSLGGLGALSAALAILVSDSADFDKLFNLGQTIAKSLQAGRTLGASTFCALHNSQYPTAFYSSGAKWWGKSFDEMMDLPSNPVWPFDFGLIFSGNLVQGAAVISSAEEVKITASQKQRLATELTGRAKLSFWSNYMEMLDQISNQTMLSFLDVLNKGTDDSSLRRFFEGLNQYQNLLHFLNISTPNIDKIYSLIHAASNKNDNGVGSGCKITGVGKGGEVLFAVPYGRYREKIPKLIKKLEGTSLDFTSWSGGTEVENAHIDQDLVKNIISEKSGDVKSIMRIYTKNGLQTKLISDKKMIIEADVVFDTIKAKIFVNGKTISSKDLPSQKMSVEIMSKLLMSEKYVLNNDQLGSYGKSRYDLQGKIAIPLSKLIGLDFEITGGVYDDFSIRLKPLDLKIAVISAIN
jgi:mevalonate kinase